nr:MAG TPA: hypothetical protein [Caudoviricetes sp.]
MSITDLFQNTFYINLSKNNRTTKQIRRRYQWE